MISGVINVYKEKGMTSHDVIWHMRKILMQKKIGHTGTLDPAATGVLPVCLGMGTRLCDLIQEGSKEYKAVLLLGTTTDTQDTTGTVLSQCEVKVTPEQVIEAVAAFVGTNVQVPPMYSAVKINGQKLYELARKGIEVERSGREITVHEIRIEKIDLPEVTMVVTCSRGTYIRTLCEDIGKQLGCGGCMASLERLRVGDFSAGDALTLDQIRDLAENDELAPHILPVDHFFPDAVKVQVETVFDKNLYNGNSFSRSRLHFMEGGEWTQRARVYDSLGNFVGLFEKDRNPKYYRPLKMFWQQ